VSKKIIRQLALYGGLCLFVLSFVLAGKGQLRVSRSTGLELARVPPRVLMVGDSLSVGAFGGVLYDFLVTQFGPGNVAVYASCGSAPENWLRSQPDFVTKCGFREQLPQKNVVLDFVNGRPPRRVVTPKLENIVRVFRPEVVIVQLGTNWLDRLEGRTQDKNFNYADILDQFVIALRSQPGAARRIIWITPPDSSHFAKKTQRALESIIKAAARRDRFETIISSGMTRYVPGKTGGDGIHYNSEASTQWALDLMSELLRKFK
jgi:hypothetical protein